jgi:hypothetical protein
VGEGATAAEAGVRLHGSALSGSSRSSLVERVDRSFKKHLLKANKNTKSSWT